MLNYLSIDRLYLWALALWPTVSQVVGGGHGPPGPPDSYTYDIGICGIVNGTS